MQKVIRPKLVPKLKRQITNDWLQLFPSLTKESTCSLGRRVGPILISVWYDTSRSSPEYYRINSSVRNLSNEDDIIGITLGYQPDRGRLSWNQHERGGYKESAQQLRENTPIPLEGPVTLKQVIDAYLAPKVGGYSGRVREDPCLIAAWAGKTELAQELLKWGRKIYEEWLEARIEYNKKEIAGGTPADHLYDTDQVNIPEWYEKLKAKVNNPERLRETVESEVVKHKLTKIPYSDLIIE